MKSKKCATWAKTPESLRTHLYSKSFQTENRSIYVFSYHGWNNDSGEFDQAIVIDKFRLKFDSSKPFTDG